MFSASKYDKSYTEDSIHPCMIYDSQFLNSEESLAHFYKEIDIFLSKRSGDQKISILDAGAGNGFVGMSIYSLLKKRGYDVFLDLCDINEVKNLKLSGIPKSDVRVLTCNLSDVQKNNENLKYDIVVSRSVIHYAPSAPEKEEVYKALFAVLKDGGVFLNQALIFSTQLDLETFVEMNNLFDRKLTPDTLENELSLAKKFFSDAFVSNFQTKKVYQTVDDSITRFSIKNQEEFKKNVSRIYSLNSSRGKMLDFIDERSWELNLLLIICHT